MERIDTILYKKKFTECIQEKNLESECRTKFHIVKTIGLEKFSEFAENLKNYEYRMGTGILGICIAFKASNPLQVGSGIAHRQQRSTP